MNRGVGWDLERLARWKWHSWEGFLCHYSFLMPAIWRADVVAGPGWLSSIYSGPAFMIATQYVITAERQMMGKLPWWAVQGKYRLPASRILLYEKERNLFLVCAMIILHFLLHVANYISSQRISFATVWPWIRHTPSLGNIALYTVAVVGVGNLNDHWR